MKTEIKKYQTRRTPEMKLLRTEYQIEHSRPVVYKFLRDNGNRTIVKDDSLVPYFYISEDEIGKVSGVRVGNDTYTAFDGTKLRKVLVNFPGEVPELREKYSKTYEADILFPLRYLIDRVNILEQTQFKIFYLDIEVDNAGRVPSADVAEFPIICLSIYDNMTHIYTTFVFRSDFVPGMHSSIVNGELHEIQYYKDERSMLEGLVKFFEDEEPDVVTGWNLVSFDMKYLLNRLKNIGLDENRLSPMGSAYTERDKVVIKGIALVDLYSAYLRLTENVEESYTLDYIARKVIGMGKTQSQANVRWMWKNEIDKLIEYNVTDVQLIVGIDQRLKIIDFLDEVRRMAFCQLEDALTTTRVMDCYILRMFHDKIVFPTKTKHPEVPTIEGAMVNSWAKGLYDNVIVFDLKSLYPSIIVSANLSPETMENGEKDYIIVDNLKIGKTKGFLPQVVEQLWESRAYYKSLMKTVPMGSDEYKLYDMRQRVIKRSLLNGLYGQTGYHGSRFYDPRITKTITFLGRQILGWSKNFIEGLNYKVLYVDTDGEMWAMGDRVDYELVEYIRGLLNESYGDFARQYGLESHMFEVEFQKVFRKAFFGTAKKRYASHTVWKEGQIVDEVEVIGFEVRRSDNSQFSRKLQSTVFSMILKEDRTKEEVLRYIGGEIDRLRKGDYRYTEIGIPKGITKELSEYDKPMVNVRAAQYALEVLGQNLSSKPKMVYVSKLPDNLPTEFKGKHVDAICFDEDNQVPPGTVIDVEKMLDKMVKRKVEGIFEALGWKMGDLDVHWRGKAPKAGQQETLFEVSDIGWKGRLTEVKEK